MIYEKAIEGRYVNLKSADIDDAEFTREIRQDPMFSCFIPQIKNSIEQQRKWINQQREKEGDYFFVVWDKENNRLGTISIYDVEGNHAETGRLVMRGNAFQNIEAQLLSFQFAFDVLNLDYLISYIYQDNERAIRFDKQFGGYICGNRVTSDGHEEVMTINSKDAFEESLKKFKKILYR